MASAYTTKGTSVETQALEILERLADLQSDVTPSGSNPDNAVIVSNYTRNMTTGIVTATLTLPVSSTPDATSGLPVLSVEEVFS